MVAAVDPLRETVAGRAWRRGDTGGCSDDQDAVGKLLTINREADRIGMILMAEACYDPRAAPQVWQRMAKLSQSSPEILSTHPAHENRIEQLSAHLAEAMTVREKAGCKPLSGPSS